MEQELREFISNQKKADKAVAKRLDTLEDHLAKLDIELDKIDKRFGNADKKYDARVKAYTRSLAKRIDDQAEESRRYIGVLKEDTDSKFQALLEIAQSNASEGADENDISEQVGMHDLAIGALQESARDHELRIRNIEVV